MLSPTFIYEWFSIAVDTTSSNIVILNEEKLGLHLTSWSASDNNQYDMPSVKASEPSALAISHGLFLSPAIPKWYASYINSVAN